MRNLANALLMGATAFVLSTGMAFAGDVEVSDARVRLLPGDIPGAGYFHLHNGSDETIKLVGAHSDAYGKVEIHQSMEKDGMMHMHAVPAIEIKAGESFELAPSGYHLMLMQRSVPLELGDDVEVTLEFEGHDPLPVTFDVVSPADM
ncbi:copper chaperone PCu(A)C [Marinobacter bohaiensis]|uniref:copper chaperone PCu(A)C n=1 Tax=Marinobacter bohaiensis TaxID=2201898 RepID=UPI000DAC2143|nr:copper chaperone PCu(A)C [Marinobacter bohaiensis]